MAKYTIEERIKIGQDTFYRLLETEYGDNVREEMAKKYGVTLGNISTYLNMFKRNIVEPRPSMEELLILEKYHTKRCQQIYAKVGNGANKKYNDVMALLDAKTEDEYMNVIKTYGTNMHLLKK